MTSTTQQGMSEERLTELEQEGRDFNCEATLILAKECRRLRQREADLETALNLQEGLSREIQQEHIILKDQLAETQRQSDVILPYEHSPPSWLAQDPPEDDHGEYARGVRVP